MKGKDGAPLGDKLLQSVVDRLEEDNAMLRQEIRADLERILQRDDRLDLLVELLLQAKGGTP